MGNKSKYNYKKKQKNQFVQITDDRFKQELMRGQQMSESDGTMIPNFTEGEMSIFMALAEAMKEVDRLREMVVALGGNPDVYYTSDDIGGRAGGEPSDQEEKTGE
ncbi:MAG: hypothetical protein ACO3CH_00700 [Ilumatobacteraceae bacterium]